MRNVTNVYTDMCCNATQILTGSKPGGLCELLLMYILTCAVMLHRCRLGVSLEGCVICY